MSHGVTPNTPSQPVTGKIKQASPGIAIKPEARGQGKTSSLEVADKKVPAAEAIHPGETVPAKKKTHERSVATLSCALEPTSPKPLLPTGGTLEASSLPGALSEIFGLTCKEKIGFGGYSEVYEYFNKQGDKFAVKKINQAKIDAKKPSISLDKGEIHGFALNGHPNIIHTHAIILFNRSSGTYLAVCNQGELEKIPACEKQHYCVAATVCERFDGLDLVDDMEQGARLGAKYPFDGYAEEDVLRIGSAVARALVYMHGKGIVYRDVKPDNVMIDKTRLIIKVVDFGFCKSLPEKEKTKTFCGTTDYMSPEIVLLDKKEIHGYGRKVDSWSLGALLLILRTKCPITEISTRQRRLLRGEISILDKYENILAFSKLNTRNKKELLFQLFRNEFGRNSRLKNLIVQLTKFDPEERISVEKALSDYLEK